MIRPCRSPIWVTSLSVASSRPLIQQFSADYGPTTRREIGDYALLLRSARVNASNSVNHLDGLTA
jgi:hypothetical protein